MKWLFEEEGWEAAERMLDLPGGLTAPDLLILEVGNAVWKKQRRNEIPVAAGREALALLRAAPLLLEPSSSILEEAWEVAVALDRSVYDATYLALAVARDIRLVTDDRRLHASAVAGGFREHVVLLRNLSA